MIHNEHMTKAFIDRVKLGQPHTGTVIQIIQDVANLGDRLTTTGARLATDRNLTPDGQRSKLAELVRTDLVKAYATASRQARKAPAFFRAQREALGLPEIDKSDLAGELKRQEMRAFLRSLPAAKRRAMLNELEGEIDRVQAVLDAPAYMSGLDDDALGMPHTDTYARLKERVVTRLHGPKIAALDAQADDYACAVGMATAIRQQLFQASGLTRDGFEELVQPLEAAADA